MFFSRFCGRQHRPWESDATKKSTQAARIANAHDFIMELPQAYQTNMAIQRQAERRSATTHFIARAILKNPDILILDEATS